MADDLLDRMRRNPPATDGKTPEEAAVNVQDAILCWIETTTDLGREVPMPTRTLSAAE